MSNITIPDTLAIDTVLKIQNCISEPIRPVGLTHIVLDEKFKPYYNCTERRLLENLEERSDPDIVKSFIYENILEVLPYLGGASGNPSFTLIASSHAPVYMQRAEGFDYIMGDPPSTHSPSDFSVLDLIASFVSASDTLLTIAGYKLRYTSVYHTVDALLNILRDDLAVHILLRTPAVFETAAKLRGKARPVLPVLEPVIDIEIPGDTGMGIDGGVVSLHYEGGGVFKPEASLLLDGIKYRVSIPPCRAPDCPDHIQTYVHTASEWLNRRHPYIALIISRSGRWGYDIHRLQVEQKGEWYANIRGRRGELVLDAKVERDKIKIMLWRGEKLLRNEVLLV